MNPAVSSSDNFRFGPYEANLATGELWHHGSRIRMQPQPFHVLSVLLARHGQVVSRAELKSALWPDDTYVEFDVSLNAAIRKLRRTLNDNPQHPRYVETLPRNGYRFIFPVTRVGPPAPEVVSPDAPAPLLDDAIPIDVVKVDHDAGSIDRVPPSQPSQQILLLLVAALAVALMAVAYVHFSSAVATHPIRRFAIPVDAMPPRSTVAVSPDGQRILYVSADNVASSLWVRDLDREEGRRIDGTQGAVDGFWAPDSRSVGFGTGQELKRVALDGSSPTTICELPGTLVLPFDGASWSPDGGQIVFASGGQLYKAPARGGNPEPVFEQIEGPRNRFSRPHFLPTTNGSRVIVYTASVNTFDRRLAIADLDTGIRRDLGPGSSPVYSASGYLLHGAADIRTKGMKALPFSVDTLEVTGEAFGINETGTSGSVSQDGTLVYRDTPAPASRRLVWRDRLDGHVLETVGPPQPLMRSPAVAADGQWIATTSMENGNSDVWILDLARETRTRLTADRSMEDDPAWAPDGEKIAYWQLDDTGGSIRVRATHGAGEVTTLVSAKGRLRNPEWSADGRILVFADFSGALAGRLRYVEIDDEGRASDPIDFHDSPGTDHSPRLSSDGRYLAYVSTESGRSEVYIRTFPDGDSAVRAVSSNGGMRPRWRADGRELYYVEGGTTLVAVSVAGDRGKGIVLGRPLELFSSEDLRDVGFVPSPDGRKFLTLAPVEENLPVPTIHVVENWYQEFRDLQ